MKEQPQSHLDILARLAQEYEQKFEELAGALENIQPAKAVQQLRLRSEITTDRFRSAQRALLCQLTSSDSPQNGDDLLKAAGALCRCFDEMRILFRALLEYAPSQKDA